MRSSRRMRGAIGAGILALVLGAAPAAAQGGDPIELGVMVCHISDAEGSVDPRAARLHGKIKDQFKYRSLRVLQDENLRLEIDQLGSLRLPNGRRFRVRAMDVGDEGVLLAVDVEGAVKSDMRVRDGHLVVIGAGPYEGGTLVISLEPHL